MPQIIMEVNLSHGFGFSEPLGILFKDLFHLKRQVESTGVFVVDRPISPRDNQTIEFF